MKKLSYQVLIEKNNNFFHVITTINSKDLKITPFSIHKLTNYFSVSASNRGLFFNLEGFLGNSYQKLILENVYFVNNQSFKVKFNFQNNQWSCLFFGLSVNKFLLGDIKQLKSFLIIIFLNIFYLR
ncbi:hypothetical protein [Rickettsiella massiliensis]|uniref:hypothetical protein n=1 Tax=Rickettsiella massiliensis TaxID=676517 RepID=UPI00029A2E7A|nr:hypothetical protein [Rickettsiella massiliensis]